jgi:hypothetical protein
MISQKYHAAVLRKPLFVLFFVFFYICSFKFSVITFNPKKKNKNEGSLAV